MIANPPGRLTEERTYPALLVSSVLTPRADLMPSGYAFITLLSYISFSVIPLSHRYAGYCLGAGDCKSPKHKEVRTFFDGGLQIRQDA